MPYLRRYPPLRYLKYAILLLVLCVIFQSRSSNRVITDSVSRSRYTTPTIVLDEAKRRFGMLAKLINPVAPHINETLFSPPKTNLAKAISVGTYKENTDVKYIIGLRGEKWLLHNEYLFTVNNCSTQKIFWVCTGYPRTRCKFRMVTDHSGQINRKLQQKEFYHNHPPPTRRIDEAMQKCRIVNFGEIHREIRK